MSSRSAAGGSFPGECKRSRLPSTPDFDRSGFGFDIACLTRPCICARFFSLPGKAASRAVPPPVTSPASPPRTALPE